MPKSKNRLVVFGSKDCEPCKALKKVLAELINEGVSVEYVDVSSNDARISKWGVMSVPVLFPVDTKGNPVGQLNGFQTKDKILDLLEG